MTRIVLARSIYTYNNSLEAQHSIEQITQEDDYGSGSPISREAAQAIRDALQIPRVAGGK
jgi:hypothetical protein